MNRHAAVAIGVVASVLTLAGCGHRTARRAGPPKPSATQAPAPSAANANGSASVPGSDTAFTTALYAEPQFQASSAPYHVAPDFGNVGNWPTLGKLMDPGACARLQRDMFVVLPANRLLMPFIYEENTYSDFRTKKDIPSFVTTDSILHTFHVFYDVLLRNIEADSLFSSCQSMTRKLLEGAVTQYGQSADPLIKAAALKNIAYLLVPARALSVSVTDLQIPDEARRIAAAEWTNVQAHHDTAVSPSTDSRVDYTRMAPRGHYTRSPRLTAYFLAMSWYGLASLNLREDDGSPRAEQVRQAVLMGRLLSDSAGPANGAGGLWKTVYEPTAFMVGGSDDYNMVDIAGVADRVAGNTPLDQVLVDDAALRRIVDAAYGGRPTRIERTDEAAQVPVRLMGQRFILDSYLFENLVHPRVRDRKMPSGCDLFAAMGNDRAWALAAGGASRQAYDAQLRAMRDYVAKQTPQTWQSDVYWGWLDVLRRVVEPKGPGYPSFMQSMAWQDKSLNTALGSWAELRHDTTLYAKQSAAEAGEGGSDEPDAPPTGYVEPDVRSYDRLRFLLTQLRTGLKARGLMGADLDARCEDLDKLLGQLVSISQKELRDQPLTGGEEETIRNYGHTIATITLFTHEEKVKRGAETWTDVTTEVDNDMAVVADVHTSMADVLEEGVGHANEIWVVFPARGKLWLGRGGVFSYYEFTRPASARMTDEQWQKQLKSGKAPALPVWTSSFYYPKGIPAKKLLDERLSKGGRAR